MKHKEESTRHEPNGLAKDSHKSETTSRTTTTKQEMQGYVVGAAGILLLTFAFTGFSWLKWMTVAGSVGLIVYGIYRANVIERLYHYIQGLRK